MGGIVMVMLGAAYAHRIDSITAGIRALLARLESELSVYDPGSSISLLKEHAGVREVRISEDALRVLRIARDFGDIAEGAFDVTMAPLAVLWGFRDKQSPTRVPSKSEVDERLRLVDYRRLILGEQTAFLPEAGMAVDLGGIAKGFAVDCAYEYCRSMGVQDFLLDMSGNIRVSGHPQDGEEWRIGVRNPFDRMRMIGMVTLPDGAALSTSGSYERFVEIAGGRYSHIIDPRNGLPVRGTAGVTILADNAIDADCFSTLCFVVGLDQAPKFLTRPGHVEALIVPDRSPIEIHVSAGFLKTFVSMPAFSGAIRILESAATRER